MPFPTRDFARLDFLIITLSILMFGAMGCSHPQVVKDRGPIEVDGNSNSPAFAEKLMSKEHLKQTTRSIEAPFYFAFDSSKLDGAARSHLTDVAKKLKADPDEQILITGACDERGSCGLQFTTWATKSGFSKNIFSKQWDSIGSNHDGIGRQRQSC